MFCANCGKEISEDARFCLYCGTEQKFTESLHNEAMDKSIIGKVRFSHEFKQESDIDTNAASREDDVTVSRSHAEEEVLCPFCGTANPADAVFCEECGKNMLAESVVPTDIEVDHPIEIDDSRICPFCGAENKADFVFCIKCGKNMSGTVIPPDPPVPSIPSADEVRYCPHCGAKNKGDSLFCEACGKNMNIKGGGLKGILTKMVIAAIAVAAIIVVFMIAKPLISSHNGNESKLVYAENGNMYLIDARKPSKSIELDGDYDDSLAYALADTAFTSDGKYICYPAANPNETYSYSLYMRKMNSKAAAVKIASYVRKFQLLDNGKVVYENQDGTLYITDYKENKEKLSAASSWEVTDNQKYVIWQGAYSESSKAFDGLYYVDTELKQDTKKLASAVTNRFQMTPDAKKIVFLEGDDLFEIDNFGEKEKIAKDVKAEPCLDDNGDVYYLKPVTDITLYDLIDDDLAESEEIAYPNQQDYEHSVQKDNGWLGSYTTTEVDWDAYNEAMNEYNAYQSAEIVRNYLKDKEKTGNVCKQVCVFSKGKEKVLETNALFQYQSAFPYSTREQKYLPSICYYKKSPEAIATLSELCSWIFREKSSSSNIDDYEILDALFHYVTEECSYTYCGKKGTLPLSKNLGEVICDESGKTGYGFIWEDNREVLYTFALSGENAGKCNLYAEYVCMYSESSVDGLWLDHDDVYYKTCKNDEYSLYKNKDIIADDIGSYRGLLIKDGVLYYTSDENNTTNTFTLHKYEKGKITDIADDVYRYHIFDSDLIAILKDYSTERSKGTLDIYNGKKTVSISDDVRAIA